MTEFKRRTLFLSTGKQIKLYGNSMAIGRSLEIGEGSAPNILSFIEQQEENLVLGLREERTVREKPPGEGVRDEQEAKLAKPLRKPSAAVSNPYRLTPEEIQEIADFNIRLWLDLKDKIREYGVNDPKIFNKEA